MRFQVPSLLVAVACSCLALCLGPASAADPACLLGSVCGNGCTSVTGSCSNGQCVGLFGSQESCQPFTNACGSTYCAVNTEFCANGECQPNNCQNQKQYGCAGDTSALSRVTCPDGSSSTACWASASGGFKCNENANGPSELACSVASGSGSTASGTSTTTSGPGVSTSAPAAAPAAEGGVVSSAGPSSAPAGGTTDATRGETSASVVGGPTGTTADGNVALGSSAPPPSQGAAAAAAVSVSMLAAAAAAAVLLA